jgi:uncharacterized protein DUF5655
MTDTPYTIEALFAGKDEVVRATYDQLLEVLRALGPFTEEPKKTSIHLVRSGGFAGVHPRKSYLILNLRTAQPIESPRIAKTEQVSKNRYHNEVKLGAPDAVDADVRTWLGEAYSLGE